MRKKIIKDIKGPIRIHIHIG